MSGRRLATSCLIGLTCVLTLVSALALWLRALVLNTDSYVRAIAPVLDDPAVRDSLAETIVAELYSHVDVAANVRDALPRSAADLAPTLAAGIRSTSVQVASTALGTPAVKRAWKEANRIAHRQIVRVLEGKGEIVTTANGEVAIDTGALAASVRRALDENGIHVFDAVNAAALDRRFVLFRSTDLMHAQQATRALDATATLLPLATIAAGAAAIVCSMRRRRAVELLAVGIAGVMVIIAVGAAIGRAYYLAHVGTAYRTIAAAPFDALLGPLRKWTRVTFAVAIGAFVVAWFSGSDAMVAGEHRARAFAVGVLRRNARPFAVGGAFAAAVLLVAWNHPRPLVVCSTLVALALWELLCWTAGRATPPAGAGTVAPPD
ncbi:MAG TPA: hypothetical protein VGP92_09655 [Acidimicrobiia bacterium]|nr:hypothetical protein [Acidimicrobiia bacterium]